MMARFFFISFFLYVVGIGSVKLEFPPSWNLGMVREDGAVNGINWGKLGEDRSNWGKLGEDRSNWGKLGEDRSNWGKLGEDRSNWGKLGEDRSNLTIRISALCPANWNYTLYIGGSGTWLSKDPTKDSLLPMKQVSSELWQFDLSYNNGLDGYSCNNCFDNNKLIQTGEFLQIRLYASVKSEMIPMVGVMTKVKFPLSATSAAFNNPPEVVITPNFDNPKGDIYSFSAVHPLFGDREIAIYLPPGYFNPHKKFPVTIAIDVDLPTLESIEQNLNNWFITSNVETIILGFGDFGKDDVPHHRDRTNLLTPSIGDGFECKTGSFGDGCGGCLPGPLNLTMADYIRCCDVIHYGGGGDEVLDWLLGDIMDQLEKSLPGRVLTGRDHLGVVGFSLGGLFSCHAAWTRDQLISRAACQSPSFWWPTNAGIAANDFDFLNKTLRDPKLSVNRYPQRILIDVGGDEQPTDDYWMVGGAQQVAKKMEELPFFNKDNNLWIHVYPGKLHTFKAWIDRLWNALKIIWN